MHAANYTVSASGRMHVPYTGANRAAIRIRLRLRLDLAPVAINNYAVLVSSMLLFHTSNLVNCESERRVLPLSSRGIALDRITSFSVGEWKAQFGALKHHF